MGPSMTRTRDQDACPGALTVHQAADGALVRIRLAGGAITAAQLAALADVASNFGSPAMELTSRGNIQIRALTDTDAVAAALADAGLLPSPTHERVRNIVASPLTGRCGGVADVGPLVTDLDTAMMRSNRAGPELGFSLEPAEAVAQAIIEGIEMDAFDVIRGGEVRAEMIAMNRTNPAAVDEKFLTLKDALEDAVKDHNAL